MWKKQLSCDSKRFTYRLRTRMKLLLKTKFLHVKEKYDKLDITRYLEYVFHTQTNEIEQGIGSTLSVTSSSYSQEESPVQG